MQRPTLLLAVDFDGTLAPLAGRPEAARLAPATRRWLRALAGERRVRVVIASGRGLDDLRRKVGLRGIYYIGNHGLEIGGPGVSWTHPAARRAASQMRRAATLLEESLAAVPGARIEDKRYSLTLHYRGLADPAAPGRLRRLAAAVVRRSPALRLCAGKKVWEIRPSLRWDKGAALLAVRGRFPGRPQLVFIGDDVSDEEAFRTLGSRGVSIRVGRGGRSAAALALRSQSEVPRLLERLARLFATR